MNRLQYFKHSVFDARQNSLSDEYMYVESLIDLADRQSLCNVNWKLME